MCFIDFRGGRVNFIEFVKDLQEKVRVYEMKIKQAEIALGELIEKVEELEGELEETRIANGELAARAEELEEHVLGISQEKIEIFSQLNELKKESSEYSAMIGFLEKKAELAEAKTEKTSTFFYEKTQCDLDFTREIESVQGSSLDENEKNQRVFQFIQGMIAKMSFELIHFDDLVQEREETMGNYQKKIEVLLKSSKL